MSKADAATLPLGPAKPAARPPAAAAAPAADAWSIPAVQLRTSECGRTTSQQGCEEACCVVSDAVVAPTAESSTTAAALCLSLDLELSPEEVRGWGQLVCGGVRAAVMHERPPPALKCTATQTH